MFTNQEGTEKSDEAYTYLPIYETSGVQVDEIVEPLPVETSEIFKYPKGPAISKSLCWSDGQALEYTGEAAHGNTIHKNKCREKHILGREAQDCSTSKPLPYEECQLYAFTVLDIGGHVMEVLLVVFQILLFTRLED